jgi:hypothetical protein
MRKIDVKYIDTRKYIVDISQDQWFEDGPDSWGNYKLVQFRDRDWSSYEDIDEYLTESGKLLPKYQAMLKSGKMFTIDYRRYSNTGGGFYHFDGAMKFTGETIDSRVINGFIIFEDAYVKGISYEKRKDYAISDLGEYTDWANGEVYCAAIRTDTGIEIDQICGLIGRAAVDQYIKDVLPDALPENVEEVYIS